MRQSFHNFHYRSGVVKFVNASKAIVPASASVFASNSTLIIPIPQGTKDGDLMVAFALSFGSGGVLSTPAGWTVWRQQTTATRVAVYYRFASSEPASYTWTASIGNSALGGEIATFRNALPGALALQLEPNAPPGDMPVRTAPSLAGSAIMAMFYTPNGSGPPPAEDITAFAPLTLAAQHATSSILAMGRTAIAYETNIRANEVITGRHMEDPLGAVVFEQHLLAHIRAADGPTPISATLVGSTKATTPASGAASDPSTNLIIPVPGGVQPGDHLFALTTCATATTPPAGWNIHSVNGGNLLAVWYKIAALNEPVDYTWTVGAGLARSGCMIAVRGGQLGINTRNAAAGISQVNETTVLGTITANNGTSTMTVPTLEMGAMNENFWIGFVACAEADNDEDFTVTGTHVLQTQHAATGRSSAISIIASVNKHTSVTGNVFVDAEAAGNRRTTAIVLEPI